MAKVKIALVNPVNRLQPTDFYGLSENIEIGYIASSLREAGFTVEIMDSHNLGWSASQTAEYILEGKFGLVITWGLLSTLPFTFKLAREVKSSDKKIFISTGGRHTTFAAKEVLEDCQKLDAVFLGEGELTALAVARALKAGKAPTKVKGLAYVDAKHGFVSNPRDELPDLEKLPMPARDSLERLMIDSSSSVRPTLIVQTSRGCYGACSFCCDAIYPGAGKKQAWRARTPESVVDELEHLAQTVKARYPMVYFADSNFIGQTEAHAKRALDIARLIKSRKNLDIKFEIKSRVDSFIRPFSDELVGELREAGLRSVLLGIEAGNDHDLGIYNKGINRGDIDKAVELLQKHRIDICSSGFITFNPYQSLENARANIEIERDMGQASLWNIGRRVELLPGCSMIGKLEADGLLKPDRRYDNVFGYRFRDNLVERACKALDFYDNDARLLEDATVRLATHMMSRFDEAYDKMKGFITDEQKKLLDIKRGEFQTQSMKLNTLNSSFALETIDRVEDLSDEAMKIRKREHVDNVDRQLENINHALKELTRANLEAAEYAAEIKDGKKNDS